MQQSKKEKLTKPAKGKELRHAEEKPTNRNSGEGAYTETQKCSEAVGG